MYVNLQYNLKQLKMKQQQQKNPLKKMEEQIDRILFSNNENKIHNNKIESIIQINSLTDMKEQLIQLVKELKVKRLHLVA